MSQIPRIPRSAYKRLKPTPDVEPPSALQRLSDLDLQAKRQKYPSVPLHAVPVTRFSDKTANNLTRAVLRCIQLHGGYATRVQSQGQWNPVLKQWTRGTTRRGAADVHAACFGLHLSIEIKIGKDPMSEAQRQTCAEVERAGGRYFVARTFEDFYQWFTELQTKNPTTSR